MFPPAESIIHPQNRQETGRIFVMDNVEPDKLRRIARHVMDLYAEVIGKNFSSYDLRDYPKQMIDQVSSNGDFEFRFGMPKLRYPASSHGKLWGRAGRLVVADDCLNSVGFWVDTNDDEYAQPSPTASRELAQDFDTAIKDLADEEFGDISLPAPLMAVRGSFYNPAILMN